MKFGTGQCAHMNTAEIKKNKPYLKCQNGGH